MSPMCPSFRGFTVIPLFMYTDMRASLRNKTLANHLKCKQCVCVCIIVQKAFALAVKPLVSELQ